MKKAFLCFAMLLAALGMSAAKVQKPVIDRIDPPYWWTGMAADTLQMMVYGPNIAAADLTIDYPGVTIAERVPLTSPDYQLLYLNISDDTKPGLVPLTFANGKKKTVVEYQLKERDLNAGGAQGFDGTDVLYLIMPDRFAKAEDHSSADMRFPTQDNRRNHHARHGGDIPGIQQHLGYIDSLGITAIWLNPVLENDMPGGSYHGYATTDYYRIDRRMGTNDQYRDFIAAAHDKGLKVVMDMIFNHSGSEHPWMENPPMADWYNYQDSMRQTNHRLTTVFDPYASDFDKERTVDGWFTSGMPDLNQRNPHVARYLIQNSIWWIEDSRIDGIRQDTHPYADMEAMAQWVADVQREYPAFNIVGECWYNNEGMIAYWQRDSKVNKDGNPNLPTIMDFYIPLHGPDAFYEKTVRGEGLDRLYHHLTLDYLYPDPSKILVFLDNHDTDRFLREEPTTLDNWKQGMTYLLTGRGIPQLYYGTEILMSGTRAQGGDGNIRRDFPGGFPGDTVNAFTAEGRTPQQNEAWDFLSKLLNWRRTNEAVGKGTFKHWIPEEGVYIYQRAYNGKDVTVMMNGRDEPVTFNMECIAEVLPAGSVRHDILTDTDVTITPEMTFTPRQILILEN